MIDPKEKRKRAEIFARVQRTLANGVRNVKSVLPQNWLKERGLSIEAAGVGFNSGQIQHRKPKEYLDDLQSIGFIRPNNIVSKNGDTGFLVFGKYGVTFPLRDEKGNIVNFYAIRIKTKKEEHCLLNNEGIFPAFPHEMTTRLLITTSILDAVTIMESKVLENRDAVICIPGAIILPQHEIAITRLNELKKILWIESPGIKFKTSLEGRVMSKEHLKKMKAA